MILTVTLNAAIDRTVAVPSFRQGHRHRAVEASTVAGGKGVNVARALKLLDRPVIATGLAGGPTGARLMKLLYLARGARICAIAGSLPPSVPASFSARIVEEL